MSDINKTSEENKKTEIEDCSVYNDENFLAFLNEKKAEQEQPKKETQISSITNLHIISPIIDVLPTKPKYRSCSPITNPQSLFPEHNPISKKITENELEAEKQRCCDMMTEIFRERGYKVDIVHGDDDYDKIGIDIVLTKSSQTVYVKIVVDDYPTTDENPNKYIKMETVSNIKTGNPGWIYTSHADIICYCSLQNNLYFCYDMQGLRGMAKAYASDTTRMPVVCDNIYNESKERTLYSTESRLIDFNDAMHYLTMWGEIPIDLYISYALF